MEDCECDGDEGVLAQPRDESAPRSSHCSSAESLRERLWSIFDVLDDFLGDTDPHTDIPWDEWDDDDIKTELPIFWCCRQISELLGHDPPNTFASLRASVAEWREQVADWDREKMRQRNRPFNAGSN